MDNSVAHVVLGGGCFWCTEAAYKLLPGVVAVESGYAGGTMPDPDYRAVCEGTSDHAEVVRVSFDPAVIGLEAVIDFFWRIHDPTTLDRQGHDAGPQYRSIILYADEAQRAAATASRDRANPGWGGKIVTRIEPLGRYYAAEAYHQDYFARNPHAGYCAAVIRPKIEKLRETVG